MYRILGAISIQQEQHAEVPKRVEDIPHDPGRSSPHFRRVISICRTPSVRLLLKNHMLGSDQRLIVDDKRPPKTYIPGAPSRI
jgi:hypothetical protein